MTKHFKGRDVAVVGLGFGDEGKGTMVDAVVPMIGAGAVVRHNGGAQAAHNVITSDGIWHCFAQFGAGTLTPGTRTILSRFMLIDIPALACEAEVLASKGVIAPFEQLDVHPECVVVTPYHKIVGMMREEARGDGRHGTCGMGVGEAMVDAEARFSIAAKDIGDVRSSLPLLRRIFTRKCEQAETLLRDRPSEAMRVLHKNLTCFNDVESLAYRLAAMAERLPLRIRFDLDAMLDVREGEGRPIVFEGAQGALLDRQRGFTPFITKSCTTAWNARCLSDGARLPRPYMLGVLRAYSHRHGPGPFVTEDERMRLHFDDPRNPTNPRQGEFRVGHLDLVATRYAIALNGPVDGISLTCLDKLSGQKRIRVCTEYDYAGSRDDIGAHFRVSGSAVAALRIAESPPQPGLLAQVLADCRPKTWVDMEGWREDISGAKTFTDLPAPARRFIEYIQGRDGLGVPVKFASVGPRRDQKIVL